MGVLSPLCGAKRTTGTRSSSASTLKCLRPYFIASCANTVGLQRQANVTANAATLFMWRPFERMEHHINSVVDHPIPIGARRRWPCMLALLGFFASPGGAAAAAAPASAADLVLL